MRLKLRGTSVSQENMEQEEDWHIIEDPDAKSLIEQEGQ